MAVVRGFYAVLASSVVNRFLPRRTQRARRDCEGEMRGEGESGREGSN